MEQTLLEAYNWTIGWYKVIQGSIEASMLSCFLIYLSPYLTKMTCICMSHYISHFISFALTVRVVIWIWQGLGYVLTQTIALFFTKTAEGAEFLFKQFFVRIFSSIGWFFTAIGSFISRLFK